MPDASPGQLLDSMQTVEAELAVLQNDWSGAEEELIQRTSQVERLAAPRRLKFKTSPPPGVGKPTKEDLDALVLEWMWENHAELMEARLIAEAKAAACKVVFKCAEAALSSKQSRLKADVRAGAAGARP